MRASPCSPTHMGKTASSGCRSGFAPRRFPRRCSDDFCARRACSLLLPYLALPFINARSASISQEVGHGDHSPFSSNGLPLAVLTVEAPVYVPRWATSSSAEVHDLPQCCSPTPVPQRLTISYLVGESAGIQAAATTLGVLCLPGEAHSNALALKPALPGALRSGHIAHRRCLTLVSALGMATSSYRNCRRRAQGLLLPQ